MSRQSIIPTLPVVINPNFSIPENVVGVIYEDAGQELATYEIDQVGENSGEFSSALQAPSWAQIISQTQRLGPEGNYLVDVEFEIEDIVGASEYEVRVVKL